MGWGGEAEGGGEEFEGGLGGGEGKEGGEGGGGEGGVEGGGSFSQPVRGRVGG